MMSITGTKIIPWCISCRNCENICPEIFKVDPTSQVISEKFNKNAIKLLMAEKMCPVNVIQVEKEGSYSLENSTATLFSKKYLTTDTIELVFSCENLIFIPGQYISLQMSDIRGDFARSYSIASTSKTSFTLTVKLLKQWRGSSYLRKLWERSWKTAFKKITQVEYIWALGDFTLKHTPNRKVMIATGTGLAPMISMLEALPDNVEKVVVFWGRYEQDLYYIEKLESFKNTQLHICVSRPWINYEWNIWRVTDYIHDIQSDDEVYVCGNPDMVSQVVRTLINEGHKSDNMYHENFTLAGKPISIWKSILFDGNIPGLKLFHKILIYLSVLWIPLFYYSGLKYDFLGYELFWKSIYELLFFITWLAVIFVMMIRPLADIFPKLWILRKMVVLRKWFGIFSANIIVTMLVAKWIQNPSTFLAFFAFSSWSIWLGAIARLSELTALILLATSNTFSQKLLWKWWKRIQRSSYIYFYSGPIIALQYADTVLEYYIPMILLPVLWILAKLKIKIWK